MDPSSGGMQGDQFRGPSDHGGLVEAFGLFPLETALLHLRPELLKLPATPVLGMGVGDLAQKDNPSPSWKASQSAWAASTGCPALTALAASSAAVAGLVEPPAVDCPSLGCCSESPCRAAQTLQAPFPGSSMHGEAQLHRRLHLHGHDRSRPWPEDRSGA